MTSFLKDENPKWKKMYETYKFYSTKQKKQLILLL